MEYPVRNLFFLKRSHSDRGDTVFLGEAVVKYVYWYSFKSSLK
jgi:hypothetical protein